MVALLAACAEKKQAPPPALRDCKALARPPLVDLQPTRLHDGFTAPIEIVTGPNGALYVAEQAGRVKRIDRDVSEVLDISSDVWFGGEAGLLGFAFDPAFADNGYVYLHYNRPKDGVVFESVLVRAKSNDGGKTIDRASREDVLTQDQPYWNHNGGKIAFGPDGMLYLSFGDGGAGGDPQNNAQNKGSWLGKILRVDVRTKPYVVPPDNPFVGGMGRPEIWAYGLRNVWKFSFDGDKLYAADVGQNAFEEIDEIVKGGNYGWRIREGAHCYEPMQNCATAGLIDPIYEYPRTDGVSVTGGFVYHGAALPALVGKYIYGDITNGRIWALDVRTRQNELIAQTKLAPVAFTEDASREILVLDYSGAIYRLDGTASTDGTAMPRALADTGCMDGTAPAATLVRYDVNAPLWSDGAEKERAFALPSGSKLAVRADGDLELPVGGVVVKSFRVSDRLVETRLFVRHEDGAYAGYSYEWNDAQTEATLLDAGKTRQVGDLVWTYPSRVECMTCHTEAAGFTLGLEARQLGAQLSSLPLDMPIDPATVTQLVPADHPTATAEARARSYLHTNCSNCHRPGNVAGRSDLNLLVTTAITDLRACDFVPRAESFGITGERLLKPGSAAQSLIAVRMQVGNGGTGRMPPLATRLVDPAGVKAVSDWIAGLTDCRLH